MKNIVALLACVCVLVSCRPAEEPIQPLPVNPSHSDWVFPKLADTWDEGIPLGNATLGALVWKRDSALRLALDRTDLWDLRPVENFQGEDFSFAWVKKHIRNRNYAAVQERYDQQYEKLPAPSKIPGAALEFPLQVLGNPTSVRLYLGNALCEVRWADGTSLQTFVHATEPVGWFVFSNLKKDILPSLVAPSYQKEGTSGEVNSVEGQDLQRLEYEQGTVVSAANELTYHQAGYGGFSYDVAVSWEQKGHALVGTWSITSSLTADEAVEKTREALLRGIVQDYDSHKDYWGNFWGRSEVNLPDTVLQRQYDSEMYKLGSAARENSYPISLQAVWTADNGRLPPWKGDYHHDLNTQMSYWPVYASNHLQEGLSYLNTLWNQRDVFRKYTRQFFGVDGINVPGCCTLTGEQIGGWTQYSMSPTVGAWIAQHFYLHWKYSADRTFLKERAYPFLKEAAEFLEHFSVTGRDGKRTLEYSSSPEIFDNSIKAWFTTITNYDLSLMHFLFGATAELANELELPDEAAHWAALKAQLPDFDLDPRGALTFAKGFPYNESHRHFSHAMAIHPLGLIDWSDGEKSQRIIRATLERMEEKGPDWWTGFSYSWYGNMLARAFEGEKAAEYLRTFAECFCLKNTFHANGDQTKSGKSKFTYRPFTLEGGFAFAAGIQEMLLQSHTGIIRVFPAIPDSWTDVSFSYLRAMGGFLVSAFKYKGKVGAVYVDSTQGGKLRIIAPSDGRLVEVDTKPGESIIIL